MSKIRINQMGYHPLSTKQVIYVGEAKEFHLIRQDNQQVVYTGSFDRPIQDKRSGDTVCKGRFSDFQQEGIFQVIVNTDASLKFTIGNQQIEKCTDALLKAFYYQRCGITLDETYAGPWKHNECHLQKSYCYHPNAESMIQEGSLDIIEIDTRGGWHDAGDYGRYTVAAAKAVADMLLAYELFPESFDHPVDIPESSKLGEDILHEVKFELEFLLKLQRQSDGAVYTKVTTRYFSGMIMPEVDTEPLFIFDISSPATADFAASMAMAARIYQSFDQEFSNQCLEAAKKAYSWLENNSEVLFKNPSNVLSGEYGDSSDVDERFWAAAELFRTTSDPKYHDDATTYVTMNHNLITLGWATVSGYGTIAYLLAQGPKDIEIAKMLRDTWIHQAEEYKEGSYQDGYGITLSDKEYIWGSMMVLLNQCMHLIIAELLIGERLYTSVIQQNWDYLLGANPVDLSYVTGLGEKAVRYPHHRPSDADNVDAPVPGLVSGGPCAGLYDSVAKEHLHDQPPAKCFVDRVESYSTNEITIYWNSPAVFVGGYLCSLT